MEKMLVLLMAGCVCVVCLPVQQSKLIKESSVLPVAEAGRELEHRARRFINPLFSVGMQDIGDIDKMRTKRSADECEKLQLCKLHARSRQSFFAAYELYFVNKENARLWDHRARSVADCEQRFGGCYYR